MKAMRARIDVFLQDESEGALSKWPHATEDEVRPERHGDSLPCGKHFNCVTTLWTFSRYRFPGVVKCKDYWRT